MPRPKHTPEISSASFERWRFWSPRERRWRKQAVRSALRSRRCYGGAAASSCGAGFMAIAAWLLRDTAEQQGLCLGECRLFDPRHTWERYLLHRLQYLDELHRACLRMRLDPPPLGPAVGLVMMVDVAEQQARARAMNDDADVLAHPHRGDVRVLRAIEDLTSFETLRDIHDALQRKLAA